MSARNGLLKSSLIALLVALALTAAACSAGTTSTSNVTVPGGTATSTTGSSGGSTATTTNSGESAGTDLSGTTTTLAADIAALGAGCTVDLNADALLIVTDVECLRLHYAETLSEWRRRFMANRAKALELYDERFCRMWEFYLVSAEMMFRTGAQEVFQLQLSRKRDASPIRRDYMVDVQRDLKLREAERLPRRPEAVE